MELHSRSIIDRVFPFFFSRSSLFVAELVGFRSDRFTKHDGIQVVARHFRKCNFGILEWRGGDSVQCDKFQKEGKTNRMKTLLKCGRKKFGKGSE